MFIARYFYIAYPGICISTISWVSARKIIDVRAEWADQVRRNISNPGGQPYLKPKHQPYLSSGRPFLFSLSGARLGWTPESSFPSFTAERSAMVLGSGAPGTLSSLSFTTTTTSPSLANTDNGLGSLPGLSPDVSTRSTTTTEIQRPAPNMKPTDDGEEQLEARPPYLHAMIAGGLGGTSGDMLMHSLDTVKTRQQGDPHMPPKYTSLGSSYRKIIRQEGVRRGLYGGWLPALLGSFPGTVIFFGTYEWSKRHMVDAGVQPHLAYLTAGALLTAFYPIARSLTERVC
jgi:hypothetical protein